ncbi:MAG: 2-succinyl-5-enolpyruvyl-6-hydroxy-3-cyclohexene-1-carboxylic-acid synthase [Chlorobiaceae bacterium]|nr:2-succinyl-5-enolpyruvyl-6-hydroxy-3-cyclohexene-1-carboxylic-acid synthase [Chlorobiaceae bacterium]
MNSREITSLWSSIVIEELIRQGAEFFCISPGSRSTPLTVAIARNPKARWKMFVDERSAAFFALGYGRATARPAVLICTSGTAVANYFPAVVEASMDFQPMLILSADRPFELLECGANQTIRQENMFGSYTRWNMQLPLPSREVPLKALLSTIAYAVAKTAGSPAGPVHLNQPFREPLEPEIPDLNDTWLEHHQEWLKTGKPSGLSVFPEKHPDTTTVAMLRKALSAAKQPLIIAGSMHSAEEAEAVMELALDLQVPLYADFSSGMRLKSGILPWQLAFQLPTFIRQFRPDIVLHFGGHIIEKHPASALREWKPEHYIVIRPHANRFSPDHNVTLSIEASLALTSASLKGSRTTLSGMNMERTQEFFRLAGEEIDAETLSLQPVTEISAARLTSRLITEQQLLFVSNSMPVRDIDNYGVTSHQNGITCGLNRGVSGIDGILSTTSGFAAGHNKPATLLIGDIAFLHDINALSLLGNLSVPLQIIVLNNNGGGIFSFLPVSGYSDVFETHFATPQNYSIHSAAQTFGVDYACPQTNGEFIEIYTAASRSNRSIVIEIKGSRQENLQQHRALQGRINALAEEHLFVL